MNIKKLAAIGAVGLGISLASGSANALLIDRFQDDSIDFVLTKVDQGASQQNYVIAGTTYWTKTTGVLGVGDVLVSTFEVPSATVGPFPGSTTTSLIPAGMEMTGIAVTEVTQAVTGGFVLNPFSAGLNAIIGLGSNPGVIKGNAGEGAMIALFLNSAVTDGTATLANGADINAIFDSAVNVASNCTTLAACINQVTFPTLFQVDGKTGNAAESWDYVGTDNITLVKGSGPAVTRGVFNIALGTFFNANGAVLYQDKDTQLPCNGDGTPGPNCVQFVATGNLRGGVGLVNGAMAHDDFTAQKYVPEPATLALLGIGLLGLGASSRRGATRRGINA